MGSTPRKGWMKGEWSKYPLGSLVTCIEGRVWYSGCIGYIFGHGIAKSTYPTLQIYIIYAPSPRCSNYKYYAGPGDFAYGQPLGWWNVVKQLEVRPNK